MTLQRFKLSIRNFNIDIFQIILISLLPAALVAGPLIAEIILNTVCIIFIAKIIKTKNFILFTDKIFLFFLCFYFFLIISLLLSDVIAQSLINVVFYFRFFLFAFAVAEILKNNSSQLKIIYFGLSLTVFLVVFDGYYQFFNNENIFGFPKYRPDRISGFFNDDLIIGSFLLRVSPLLLGLTLFFNYSQKKLYFFNIFLLIFTSVLILLSGERAAFLLLCVYIFFLFFFVQVRFKIKIYAILFILFSVSAILAISPIIYDRYVNQIKNQFFGYGENIILKEYSPMFLTSYKMFKSRPMTGFGPKSYRYHCDDDELISFYYDRPIKIDNTLINFDFGWKELRNIFITEVHVKKDDVIQKGQKLFTYNFAGEEINNIFFSDKEGKIIEINYRNENEGGNRYINNDWFAKIEPLNSPKEINTFVSSCNTHPHNIYLQLLGETGIIGFIFVFGLFLYILYKIIVFSFNLIYQRKKLFSYFEIALLLNFLIILWPLTTTGNFFNNWLNIVNFYPLGFYLFNLSKKNVSDKIK